MHSELESATSSARSWNDLETNNSYFSYAIYMSDQAYPP